MINGIQGMFYSSQADELRIFLRDKLGLPSKDVGGGWLINEFNKADMGDHLNDYEGSSPSGTYVVSFTCDDIDGTVAELNSRGVEFKDEISDYGYGLTIHLTMPGDVEVELYQKKYK